MNLRPLGNRVIGEACRRTQTGLIVTPESYEPDHKEFLVVGVGSGRLLKDGTREPIPIEVGWRVLTEAYSAKHIEWGDRKLRLIEVSDIFFVLPP